MSHFDTITAAARRAPGSPRPRADTPAAAFEDEQRHRYGVQFHPEVVHTPHGQAMLERFLYAACGCEPAWTMASIIETSVENIRAQVGSGRAICGLSGGVDSAVAAALVHEAIGPQLTCVFVDTGLMRQDEGEQVVETFQRTQGIELHPRPGRRPVLRGALRGHRSRGEAQDHRRAVHPHLRGRVRRDRGRSASSCRARSIPTSSSRAPRTRPRSRATTTSAGCPDDMDFELVEPLAQPLQGRGAPGGRGAGPPGRDRVAAAVPRARARRAHHRRGHARARSPPSSTPTPSSARRSRRPASTVRSGSTSPCSPTSGRSG